MSAEERLARFERRTRRWNLILSCAVVGLVGYVGFKEFTVARIIRAQKLQVVGDHGKTVIELRVKDTGDGQIDTYSAKQEPMISLGTSPTGGMLNLYNQMGHPIVSVQSTKANAGAVFVKNQEGQTQESLNGGSSGQRTQLSGSLPYYR